MVGVYVVYVMTWQKIVRHVSDAKLIVESKSGNQYPVETEYERYGEDLYSQLSNDAHDHLNYWAFVDFRGDEGPVLVDWTRGSDPDPPEKAPWEH